MPPPQRPSTRSSLGQPVRADGGTPAPHGTYVDPNPDSLFLAEDDDNQWEPFDQQREEGDILGWEANDDNVGFAQLLQITADQPQETSHGVSLRNTLPAQTAHEPELLLGDRQALQATQRASQVIF